MLIETLPTFSYNGHSLSELGAVMKQKPRQVFSIPDINLVEMPFRNGDYIDNNGRYKNVIFKIPVIALPEFCSLTLDEFSHALVDWLMSGPIGYKTYRDDYNKGYFRYGIITSIEPVEETEHGVYETEVTVNCKPFLYSDVGTVPLEFNVSNPSNNSWSTTIVNPENCVSEPVITVTGSATFTITCTGQVVGQPYGEPETKVKVRAQNISGFTIDKPTEDVYTLSGSSCNDLVEGLKLPKFGLGTNTILISTPSNASYTVKVIPNWRRL